MKKWILISAVLIGLGGFIYWASYVPASSTEVVVAVDRTDTFLARPLPDEILSLYDLKNNPYTEARFRLVQISDVDYNPVTKIHLKPTTSFSINELDRPKEVAEFGGKVKNAFNSLKEESQEKSHSSVYAPIARELQRLSESKANKRVLVIFSDLMENTDTLNFYVPETLAKLKSNSASIQNILEEQVPLPNLVGIEVYIIFEPQDYGENLDFRIASEFYKSLFKSKGAKVTIGANLNM